MADADVSQLRQEGNPVIAASKWINNGNQIAATQRRNNNHNNHGSSAELEIETSEDEVDVSFESHPPSNSGDGNNNNNNDENISMVLGNTDNSGGNVNGDGNLSGNRTLGNNGNALSSRPVAHGYNTRLRPNFARVSNIDTKTSSIAATIDNITRTTNDNNNNINGNNDDNNNYSNYHFHYGHPLHGYGGTQSYPNHYPLGHSHLHSHSLSMSGNNALYGGQIRGSNQYDHGCCRFNSIPTPMPFMESMFCSTLFLHFLLFII